VALFGFRGELFSRTSSRSSTTGALPTIFNSEGISTKEEPLNPTPLNGDLLKVFEYQTLPTVDDIWWWGRSNVSYKIVTSAAFNYDHPICRAETFARIACWMRRSLFQ